MPQGNDRRGWDNLRSAPRQTDPDSVTRMAVSERAAPGDLSLAQPRPSLRTSNARNARTVIAPPQRKRIPSMTALMPAAPTRSSAPAHTHAHAVYPQAPLAAPAPTMSTSPPPSMPVHSSSTPHPSHFRPLAGSFAEPISDPTGSWAFAERTARSQMRTFHIVAEPRSTSTLPAYVVYASVAMAILSSLALVLVMRTQQDPPRAAAASPEVRTATVASAPRRAAPPPVAAKPAAPPPVATTFEPPPPAASATPNLSAPTMMLRVAQPAPVLQPAPARPAQTAEPTPSAPTAPRVVRRPAPPSTAPAPAAGPEKEKHGAKSAEEILRELGEEQLRR